MSEGREFVILVFYVFLLVVSMFHMSFSLQYPYTTQINIMEEKEISVIKSNKCHRCGD